MQNIYGIHAVDSLLRQKPASITQLLVQAGRSDKRIAAIRELAANQGVVIAERTRAELDTLVNARHQGVVAQQAFLAEEEGANLWSEVQLLQHIEQSGHPALLLILDGITDPHNLGACLRSADAAGVHAVIVPKDKSADLSPVARKVACGAAEVVPFVRVTNLSRTLSALKERGVWLHGAAGEAEQTVYDADFTRSVALVLGAEGKGLRRLTREHCDILVSLPMAGSVSSLNVSVATGVCLFEALRQRKAGSKKK